MNKSVLTGYFTLPYKILYDVKIGGCNYFFILEIKRTHILIIKLQFKYKNYKRNCTGNCGVVFHLSCSRRIYILKSVK